MTDACLTSKSVVLRDTNGRLEYVNKALCGISIPGIQIKIVKGLSILV